MIKTALRAVFIRVLVKYMCPLGYKNLLLKCEHSCFPITAEKTNIIAILMCYDNKIFCTVEIEIAGRFPFSFTISSKVIFVPKGLTL